VVSNYKSYYLPHLAKLLAPGAITGRSLSRLFVEATPRVVSRLQK